MIIDLREKTAPHPLNKRVQEGLRGSARVPVTEKQVHWVQLATSDLASVVALLATHTSHDAAEIAALNRSFVEMKSDLKTLVEKE